jgi:hypothetical protein
MRDGEQQPSAIFTTEDHIYNLRRKIESIYYQVTQIAFDNRPRLQKLHCSHLVRGSAQFVNE